MTAAARAQTQGGERGRVDAPRGDAAQRQARTHRLTRESWRAGVVCAVLAKASFFGYPDPMCDVRDPSMLPARPPPAINKSTTVPVHRSHAKS